MNEVALSRLTHDVVQNTYKELHALIDSISDTTHDERRHRLLEFLLTVRHRFVRLLVSVRWFMSYSAFHSSAQGTHTMCSGRISSFTEGADSLFRACSNLRLAVATAPALPQAVEILGYPQFFARLPRVIETSIGIDVRRAPSKRAIHAHIPNSANPCHTDAMSDASSSIADEDVAVEAVERLTAATRRIVTDYLPAGMSVFPSGNTIPLQIGVKGVWAADILIDSLMPEIARLHLRSLELRIDGHPDAPTTMQTRRRGAERPLPLPGWQHRDLVENINGRIELTTASHPPETSLEERARLSMRCLALVISLDCCGHIVMAHVRAQAIAMMTLSAWRAAGLNINGRFAEASKRLPVRLSYWPESHLRAAVSVSVSMVGNEECKENEDKAIVRVVDVAHEPPLPYRDAKAMLQVSSIDLQQLLLDSGRVRSRHALEDIATRCRGEFGKSVDIKIVSNGKTSTAFVVNFEQGDGAVVIGFSLISGGICSAVRGSVPSILNRYTELGGDLHKWLWNGERFFQNGASGLWSSVKPIVRECLIVVRRYSMMRSVWACGIGAMSGWPPGKPCVRRKTALDERNDNRIKPPLAMIERKRPRRFMTLDNVASDNNDAVAGEENSILKRPKRQSGVGVNFCQSDDLWFYEARVSTGMVSPTECAGGGTSGRGMAAWAELRHNLDLRIRRNDLMAILLKHDLISSWNHEGGGDCVHEAVVQLRISPIEIEKAIVVVCGEQDWKLRIVLRRNIFSDAGLRSGSESSYRGSSRVLEFCYSSTSRESIRSCARELMRARAAATLGMGLSNNSNHYKVLERTHRHVTVDVKGLRLMVGLGATSIEVDMWPRNELLRVHMVPLMEELLGASRKEMGIILSGLLTTGIPMALEVDRALAKEGIQKQVRFNSVLRVRIGMIVKRGVGKLAFALDIDARCGDGRVELSDVSRVKQLKSGTLENGMRTSGSVTSGTSAIDLNKIPLWEGILSKLASKGVGKVLNEQTCVQIDLNLLGKVLSAVIKSLMK